MCFIAYIAEERIDIMNEVCNWYEQDDDANSWETDCDMRWMINNYDTPTENDMNFCHKCGRKLIEHAFAQDGVAE